LAYQNPPRALSRKTKTTDFKKKPALAPRLARSITALFRGSHCAEFAGWCPAQTVLPAAAQRVEILIYRRQRRRSARRLRITTERSPELRVVKRSKKCECGLDRTVMRKAANESIPIAIEGDNSSVLRMARGRNISVTYIGMATFLCHLAADDRGRRKTRWCFVPEKALRQMDLSLADGCGSKTGV
jgi:hypothetical protein